jgi:hypothetical protein
MSPATAPVAPAPGSRSSPAVGGPSELGRAPVWPQVDASSGEGSSAATRRRVRLPVSRHTGSVNAAAPTAQLTTLSLQLASLEQERAVVHARIGEIQAARLAAARSAGSEENRNELSRLQGHVVHASNQLHKLQAARDERMDEQDDIERKLASCVRQMTGLSLLQAAPLTSGAPATTSTAPASVLAGPSLPPPAALRYSAAETAAFGRVQQLQKDRDETKEARTRAQQATRDLTTQVQRLTAAAEQIVDPDNYVLLVAEYAADGLNNYLQRSGLPPCDAERDPTRFAQYVVAFTQAEGNARRLLPELVNPRACFAAFSALHSATRPNQYIPALLGRLLIDDSGSLNTALRRGGDGLEDVVRTHVAHSFAQFMDEVRSQAEGQQPGVASGRRRRLPSGQAMSNREVAVFHARSRTLVQVQEPETARTAIIDGAVEHARQMLGQIAEGYAQKSVEVQQAQVRLDESRHEQRNLIRQAIDIDEDLKNARTDLEIAASERRRLEAAGEVKDTRPREAAIPKILTASPSGSPDPEARGMKLRGEIDKYKTDADGLTQEITQIDVRIRAARGELRRSNSELETAAAAHARSAADAQLEHGAHRENLSNLRRQLDVLDGRIEAARAQLQAHPARKATISDRAWQRAIERHVEPDDGALRARTRETGYAGAYNSQADMARAVADIHAHASRHPQLQAVLSARNPSEFDRAAVAVPGGVTDRVFDHARQVGRGFSNALDWTERATPLTQSSYSLDFVQGRVLVSHLYPYVPHRRLQPAAGSPQAGGNGGGSPQNSPH